jgi:hypothetical protein
MNIPDLPRVCSVYLLQLVQVYHYVLRARRFDAPPLLID